MYGDALTTVTRMKDRLKLTVTDFDTLLSNIILAVTAKMETLTNRRFNEGTYTHELHDGSDPHGSIRTTIITKNAPLQSVSSLQYQAGTNSFPDWVDFDEDDYFIDYDDGIITVPDGLPVGFRNIRVTYVGGYSGHSIGVDNSWVYDYEPTDTIDGSNLVFTLPVAAYQVIAYADGARESSANITFTPGGTSFSFAAGRAPTSTLSVDYKTTETVDAGDVNLPAELVEVCEEAVTRIYKRRDSEGRSSENFGESSVTWSKSVFTDEDMATIRAYRRGYFV